MIRIVALVVFLLAAGWTRGAAAKDVSLQYKGLEIDAHLTLAAGKTLKDGVALVLHGTLAHNKMEIIANLQSALAERGISSLAPTLSLGISHRTGMYDCKVPSTHRQHDALDELAVWLNWLKAQGAKHVILIGHSRGGAETAWFAATRDDPVIDKVVLISPATWNAAKNAAAYKRLNHRNLAPVLAKAKALVAAGKGDTMMKGVGILYCAGADATAASFVSYNGDDKNKDTPSLLPRIKKPVLVVVGTADKVVPDIAARVKPMADGKHIRLVMVPDAGHFYLDMLGDDLADDIAKFVKGGN